MDDPSERSVKEAESLQKLYMRREETRFGVDYSINKLESTQSQLDKALAYIRRVEAHVLNSIGSNDHLLRDMTALARDMDRVVIKEETVSSLNVKMAKMATIYQDLSTMVTIQLTDSEKVFSISPFFFVKFQYFNLLVSLTVAARNSPDARLLYCSYKLQTEKERSHIIISRSAIIVLKFLIQEKSNTRYSVGKSNSKSNTAPIKFNSSYLKSTRLFFFARMCHRLLIKQKNPQQDLDVIKIDKMCLIVNFYAPVEMRATSW